MATILAMTLKELGGIVVSVPKAFKYDFFFPRKPIPIEEQLRSQIKRLHLHSYRQLEKLIFLYGIIRAKNRMIRDLEDLLKDKDDEIKGLKKRIKSLELQLHIERTLNKRKR